MHHEEVSGYEKSKRPWLDQTPYLQLGAVKIFYDGTLSSQTAWMKHPYPSTNQHGERIMAPRDFEATLRRMRSLNLPVALHTIGDAALDEVATYLTKYPVKNGLHDRIIHASFAQQATLNKLKKIPVILDIQPQFLSSDLPWGFKLLPKQTQLIYPWASYHRVGLTLCGGSDAPVEIPNPLLGIKASVYRQSDHDGNVYGQDERLSIYEAILLYTQWANIPTYKPHERGKLNVGFVADFTVFNCDFLVNPSLIDNAFVTHTIVDDHIVYQK
jgi:predicted amidohydrolase YtcJ